MTENQKNKDEGWVLLGTKVPPHIGQLFDLLAKQRGMASYELLQLLVNGFIAAAKHDGPLTPELRLLIDSLKLDVAFNKAFSFANPTAQNEIAQVVLILQQPGRKGFGLMMIDRPFIGEARMTECVDSILERVCEVTMQGIYRRLRMLGAEMDRKYLSDILLTMIDAQTVIELNQKDRDEMRGPDNYTDTGREYAYGKKTKSIQHKGIEDYDKQQPIRFSPSDTPDLPELNDNNNNEPNADFRPFDQEW